jgi:hypothetical protein
MDSGTVIETFAASRGVCPTGIPLEAIGAIQDSIITQVIAWELTFLVLGVIIGVGFSYLYFRIWYSAQGFWRYHGKIPVEKIDKILSESEGI